MSEYRGMVYEQEVALEIALRNKLPMKVAIAEKDLLFGNTPTTLVVVEVDLSSTGDYHKESFANRKELYDRYSDNERDYEGFRDTLWESGSVVSCGALYILVKI